MIVALRTHIYNHTATLGKLSFSSARILNIGNHSSAEKFLWNGNVVMIIIIRWRCYIKKDAGEIVCSERKICLFIYCIPCDQSDNNNIGKGARHDMSTYCLFLFVGKIHTNNTPTTTGAMSFSLFSNKYKNSHSHYPQKGSDARSKRPIWCTKLCHSKKLLFAPILSTFGLILSSIYKQQRILVPFNHSKLPKDNLFSPPLNWLKVGGASNCPTNCILTFFSHVPLLNDIVSNFTRQKEQDTTTNQLSLQNCRLGYALQCLKCHKVFSA